jgi:lipopolysaccharide/colanic/teichoic acid biosynthesis glycosyltransferase
MSLVGPRPHPLAAKAANIPYQDSIDSYALRHRVKPGITGWAQVKGWRGETNTVLQLRRRVEHDVFYIEHWSLWMDLKILAITLWCVFNTKNVF